MPRIRLIDTNGNEAFEGELEDSITYLLEGKKRTQDEREEDDTQPTDQEEE